LVSVSPTFRAWSICACTEWSQKPEMFGLASLFGWK